MELAAWLPQAFRASEYSKLGLTAAWVNEAPNPKTQPMVTYAKAFSDAGMNVWSFPGEACRPAVPGWVPDRMSLQDEPVMHGITAEQHQAQIIAFESAHPNVPLVGNYEGDKFSNFAPPAGAKDIDVTSWNNLNIKQGPYFKNLPKNMIVFFDFFIFNRVRYNQDKTSYTWYNYNNLFASLDFILQYHPEVGVFIEASNQCIDINSRAPNRGELRGEAIGCLIWGARHLAFFFNRPGNKPPNWATYGDVNDACPPELKAEIKVIADFAKQFELLFTDAGGSSTREINGTFIGRKWASGYELVMNLSKKTYPTATNPTDFFAPFEARMYFQEKVVWVSKEQSESLPYAPPVTPTPAPIELVPKSDLDAAQSKIQGLTIANAALQEAALKYQESNAAFQLDAEQSKKALSELQGAIDVLFSHANTSATRPAVLSDNIGGDGT